jgi:apolipoprotein D and lipocalin family protein
VPLMVLMQGCQTMKPIQTVSHVDLQRFMGDWYVIASIPTFLEKGAHNALESYHLMPDGTIATTFTFNKDSLEGPLKTYTPRGFVRDTESNAVWDMQFIWPFKAEYRIVYLKDDYTQTIIGRTKRDYLWIMARTPSIPASELESLLKFVEKLGYERAKVQMVSHQLPTGS